MLYDILQWNYAHRGQSLSERLAYLSGLFLGKPYVLGALGEGEQAPFDQNPQYRLDAFDCLTYVNTVLALLYSFNVPEFHTHLARLNYQSGVVSYHNRHHFMSVDWNLKNAHAGFIQDITANIKGSHGYPECCYAVTYIDKPNWIKHRALADLKFKQPLSDAELQNKLSALHALASKVTGVQACTPYLPLEVLLDHHDAIPAQFKSQLPTATIVEIVRPNWNLVQQIGTRINISHLGFLFHFDGELIFRHASKDQQCVSDQSLEKYLSACRKVPTIKGINIQQILSHT